MKTFIDILVKKYRKINKNRFDQKSTVDKQTNNTLKILITTKYDKIYLNIALKT